MTSDAFRIPPRVPLLSPGFLRFNLLSLPQNSLGPRSSRAILPSRMPFEISPLYARCPTLLNPASVFIYLSSCDPFHPFAPLKQLPQVLLRYSPSFPHALKTPATLLGSQLVGIRMSVAPLHRKSESEFVTEYSSKHEIGRAHV